MKKLFLLVIGVGFLTVTKAQINLGVKGGLNFATVSGSDAGGAKTKLGFHLGGLINVPLASDVSFQPELMYSGQGYRADIGGTTVRFNLSYINIPVLIKYQLPVGLFGETGPQAGFLLSAKARANGSSSTISGVKSTDISWVFGIGYKLQENLAIDLRYNLGLTKLSDNANSKNSVFQLGVAYTFKQL